MSKVAVITDTHFGARGDSTQMQQSMQRFLENVFFPALDTHQVSEVFHAGDYGDRRKYINYQTSNFIATQYRAPMRERDLHETILVGNHDCFYRHSTETNAIEELHRHNEHVTVVRHPVTIDVSGRHILLLPWICESNHDASMHEIAHSPAQVVLGHLELQGFQMYRGLPNHEGLSPTLFDRFDLVMTGHFHHKSHNPPIYYLGAPWPMIWSDYQDPRGFHILDTDTLDLTFIENPYSLFAKLYYDDAGQERSYPGDLIQTILAPDGPYHEAYVKVIVKTKENPFWFDLVLDALYKTNAQEVVVVDDIVVTENDDEQNQTVDIDTLTLVREYVDSLVINCDKAALDKYMRDLYNEAMTSAQSNRI
jgi:DNA repair exonuclease SbcCD nuclease subunit